MKKTIYSIPGTMCNEKLWAKLESLTAEEFDFVHIPIPEAESIEEIVDGIADQLKPGPTILLGFSFGGYITSVIATRFPEIVQHLIVISNSPCSLSTEELSSREKNMKLIRQFGYRGITKGKAMSMLDSQSVSDELVNLIIEMDADLGVDSLLNQLKIGSMRQDLSQALIQSNIDVTFVHSKKDPLINKNWISSFIADNPKARLVVVSGSGHMLPLEKPEIVANAIRDLLI